ncbi:MAG: undecaprenyl-diphosphate phosphatase [Smithella sp.]|nr:undecaprenyl-diphosphate phosphatase [Smithella sp.]
MISPFVTLMILGIVQGIAEFIPISSSGHLVILEQAQFFKASLNGIGEGGMLFINVTLHVATLIALVIYMWTDIVAIVRGFFRGLLSRDFKNRDVKTGLYILIASIPAGVIGMIFHDFIEDIFSSARAAFIFLIINGFILLSTKKIAPKDRKLEEIGLIRSLGVGLFQAIAILPGISRSGMTIAGGMFLGISPMDSARFSFLMAIPVIIGAGMLEGIKAVQSGLQESLMPTLAITMVITVLVGLASLKVLFILVKNIRIYLFGLYTIAVGIAGLAFLHFFT